MRRPKLSAIKESSGPGRRRRASSSISNYTKLLQ
jgi:hypothetical protein